MSFKISGVQGLDDEIDRVVGSLLRHKGEIITATPKDKEKVFTLAFFDVISKLSDSIQVAQTTVALSTPASAGLLYLIQQFGI